MAGIGRRRPAARAAVLGALALAAVLAPCGALPRAGTAIPARIGAGLRSAGHSGGLERVRGGGCFKRRGGVQKAAPAEPSAVGKLQELADRLTQLFPAWVLAFVLLGIFAPKTVTWLNGDLIQLSVSLVMIFTGMTLEVSDFAEILKKPVQVGMGCMCQFTVMPVVATLLTRAFGLQNDIAAGVILLGCCPGGTSSNLITLIAGGDVALSVLMTSASTLLAPFVTSALVAYFAGAYVEVDRKGMLLSVINVVLGPVIAGLLINKLFPKISSVAKTITPLTSVVLVSMICGSIMGTTKDAILQAGVPVALSVLMLHCGGFVLGWGLPRMLGFSERVARTTAVETGIQSSALAVLLATKHFPSPTLSAIAGAISAPVQSVLGSLLASYWQTTATDN